MFARGITLALRFKHTRVSDLDTAGERLCKKDEEMGRAQGDGTVVSTLDGFSGVEPRRRPETPETESEVMVVPIWLHFCLKYPCFLTMAKPQNISDLPAENVCSVYPSGSGLIQSMIAC